MKYVLALVLASACGKAEDKPAPPAPTPPPASPPPAIAAAASPDASQAASKFGYCELAISGGFTLTARPPNADRTVTSHLWLDAAGKAVVTKADGEIKKANMMPAGGEPVLWIDCSDPAQGLFFHLHNSPKSKSSVAVGKHDITFPADDNQKPADFTAELDAKAGSVFKPSGTLEVTRFDRGELEATFTFTGQDMKDAKTTVTGTIVYHCADAEHCGL